MILKKIDTTGSLDGIGKEWIQHIPMYFLQTKVRRESLERNWNKIPQDMKKMLELYLPCHEHHNQPWQEEHIDGFAPAKRNCFYCCN